MSAFIGIVLLFAALGVIIVEAVRAHDRRRTGQR